MKGFVQFLLLCAVAYLFWDKFGLAETARSTPHDNPKRPQIVAPLIPEFSFHHEKTGWFDNLINRFNNDKIQGKAILDACEVDEIRPEALEMIEEENADRPMNVGQVCDLFDAVKTWAYINDPAGRDYFAHPAESHRTQRGDCDDYAIYLGSLAAATGFEAVIVIGDLSTGRRHAYPEVCLGPIDPKVLCEYLHRRYELTDSQAVHITKDAAGNLFLSLERGPYPGAIPFNGKAIMRLYLTDHFIGQY